MTTPVASAPLNDITTAVLTLLEGSGRDVWDGAYGGSPTQPRYPYLLLLRIAGGSTDPLPDLDADPQTVTVPYQVTAVSNYRNQCEYAAREARDRLLARAPVGWAYPLLLPTGWVCVDRRPDPAMPGIDRVGNYPNAIFNAPARYLITVTPA